MEWHCHFDEEETEQANFANALDFVRDLMAQRTGLLMHLDNQGRYRGGSVKPADKLTGEIETGQDKYEQVILFFQPWTDN